MRPFAFLGVFLLLVGLMVIYSAINGSGKAGMAKVSAELIRIATDSGGKFLYSEYSFTHDGEERTAKCAHKPKSAVGTRSTMYYDISKDTLMTEKARRQLILIGAASAIIGALALYFQSALTEIFG